MSDKTIISFREKLDQAITESQCTPNGIPLIGVAELDLKDAQAAPLIVLLADIVEAACVRPAAVPMTHAKAA
jgi:hypothetical protein